MQAFRTLLLLCSLALCTGEAILQHSFDGIHFSSVGRIELDAESGSNRLEGLLYREPLSSAQVSQLQALVKADGLYTVRATMPDGGPVLTSISATCFAQHLLSEAWQVTLDDAGGLVALQVSAPAGTGPCSTAKALAHLQAVEQQLIEEPPAAAVAIALPQVVPPVPRTVGLDPSLAGTAGGQQALLHQQQQQQQQQQQAPAGGQGAEGNGTRGPPPEDNRTWFQKNMMFVVAGGFMVLNIVGKLIGGDLPQQGAPPQAARPAPRRR